MADSLLSELSTLDVDESMISLLRDRKFQNAADDDSAKHIIIFPSTDSGTLTVKNQSSKVIFIPPVKHEVFLIGIKHSVIAVSAQQIRIRDCEDLQLYNFVEGCIFAESSANIRLAPYVFHSPTNSRAARQLEDKHYLKFVSSDHPFNPRAVFTVLYDPNASPDFFNC